MSPVTSARMANMSDSPVRPELKAIRFPSGDQAGYVGPGGIDEQPREDVARDIDDPHAVPTGRDGIEFSDDGEAGFIW